MGLFAFQENTKKNTRNPKIHKKIHKKLKPNLAQRQCKETQKKDCPIRIRRKL